MKRAIRNRMDSSNRPGASSRVHLTDVVDELAHDIMEKMLVGDDTSEQDISESAAREEMMARLEDGEKTQSQSTTVYNLTHRTTESLGRIAMGTWIRRRMFTAGLDLPASPDTQAKDTSRQDSQREKKTSLRQVRW